MKHLITLISALLFLLVGVSHVWALPNCEGARSIAWQNCFGTHANGDKYVGEYKDNKRNGQGAFTYGPNSEWAGDKYVGDFKDDLFHGQGTYTFSNGEQYVGDFKDGKQYGQKKPLVKKNNSENKSINRDALTVKGISIGMSVEQRMGKLKQKGYSCSNYGQHYECVLRQSKIKISTNKIEFNCHNFNMCGYKLREAANALNDKFRFPNGMDYDPEILYLADAEYNISRYCGRGKAGDVLCVKEIAMLLPLSVVLKKGSIDGGGVSFD